jgi:hypothetical protein
MPAGVRDRSYCSKSVCSNVQGTLRDTVCPGLYQGPEPGYEQPDKICLMSDDKWDFISGRYKDGSRNLNNDTRRVPRMACTFLPGCSSLGTQPIPNIGNAIWDIRQEVSFGEGDVKGTCQEIDPNKDTYTYQYEMNEYDFTKEIRQTKEFISKKNKLEAALDFLKKKRNVPYIAERDIEDKDLLELYNDSQANNNYIFVCKRKEPKATCIGGIYGNVEKGTSCVSTKQNGSPIRCWYGSMVKE